MSDDPEEISKARERVLEGLTAIRMGEPVWPDDVAALFAAAARLVDVGVARRAFSPYDVGLLLDLADMTTVPQPYSNADDNERLLRGWTDFMVENGAKFYGA